MDELLKAYMQPVVAAVTERIESDLLRHREIGRTEMKKKIVKASPMAHGHLMLEFEDGTKQVVNRGDHEAHQPQPGDMWPPVGHEHVTSGVQTGALRKKA